MCSTTRRTSLRFTSSTKAVCRSNPHLWLRDHQRHPDQRWSPSHPPNTKMSPPGLLDAPFVSINTYREGTVGFAPPLASVCRSVADVHTIIPILIRDMSKHAHLVQGKCEVGMKSTVPHLYIDSIRSSNYTIKSQRRTQISHVWTGPSGSCRDFWGDKLDGVIRSRDAIL